jgi:hypothetical protein
METITTKRAKKPYLTSLEPKKIVEFEQDYLLFVEDHVAWNKGNGNAREPLYLRSQLFKPTLLKSLKGSIVVDEEHDETFDQAFQAYLKELGIK